MDSLIKSELWTKEQTVDRLNFEYKLLELHERYATNLRDENLFLYSVALRLCAEKADLIYSLKCKIATMVD